MTNMEKIIQIQIMNWTGNDGKEHQEVIGLGEDGLVYKWHMGTGKWILYVINR